MQDFGPPLLTFFHHVLRSETALLNQDFVVGNLLSGVAGTIVGFVGNQLLTFGKNKLDERKSKKRGQATFLMVSRTVKKTVSGTVSPALEKQ